jgi:hypothetical protein
MSFKMGRGITRPLSKPLEIKPRHGGSVEGHLLRKNMVKKTLGFFLNLLQGGHLTKLYSFAKPIYN